jgi:hypothetical protein
MKKTLVSLALVICAAFLFMGAKQQLNEFNGGIQVGPFGNTVKSLIHGTATLGAGGTVVVPQPQVAANTEIYLTEQTTGGTPGFVRVSARTPGTSFTILSSSGTDTSTVSWLMVQP